MPLAPGPSSILILADPVFEPDDPRIKRGSGRHAQSSASADLVRSQNWRHQARGVWRGNYLPRLVGTRQEANAIRANFAQDKSLVALDFDAQRSLIFETDLSSYHYLQFATHGIFNSDYPELSGLILSLVSPDGRQQNGFLQLHDIYTLKLNAELVVLSSCQSGLGQEVTGEGIVGLTRGFMYAGTSRVIASLWAINDDTTSELMKEFYRTMLSEHLSPGTALRKAQLALWQRTPRQNPYFWAGFVLQGDWK
ncbi:MAG: CHAT domain-containing protein [Acidobacteria bacterium]|nr:CHAT domain-containing protein [Acidobacteriota bacterium]